MSKIIIILWALVLLCACSLPANQAQLDRKIHISSPTWLDQATYSTKIAQQLTAFYPLDEAFVSIAARLYLINTAQKHLDLQYYIWQDDVLGRMLLAALLRAADRGVEVRLLIDDQNGTQLDEQFAALMQHPNFKIKIYNPYKYRQVRAIDYVLRTKQINRRMHNKLLIADGAVAITGGRNISNEYFDASENFQFTDLDVVFYGYATSQANTAFLDFWNNDLSYLAQQLIGNKQNSSLSSLRARYQQEFSTLDINDAKINQSQEKLGNQLKSQKSEWIKANFIADTPQKTHGDAKKEQLLVHKFPNLMGAAEQQMELVSAYFVPTEKGVAYLSRLVDKGVKVRVVTNSFAANDVALVHAFYQQYRIELLKNGVELYEFKPYLERKEKTWYEKISGNMIPDKSKNKSSLHAKFFETDNNVFIGSFNFDPRSAYLNTEVGLVIESKSFSKNISNQLDFYLPKIAYQLKLNENNEIIWLEQTERGIKVHHQEPNTTAFERFMAKMIAYTPFEFMM